ncbi:MAG: hypothetical protein K0V04_16400 [Deltaproteobacteria bacterium]|nr:hypothetical protein [Deltaproteobacteria bacterium]
MLPAAKHFDPILGIDVHIIQPPGPVPPLPIPHPHVGMVMDPFDYAPFIGATTMVGGMPRAQAGTAGTLLPPHIPIGGTFITPVGNEAEVLMGSSTVAVDGDAFSYLGLPGLACQDVGAPPPPRPGKPAKTKSLVLPTIVVLSIPAGVTVGGAPTVSLMALGSRLALAAAFRAMGGMVRKVKKMRAAKKGGRGNNGVRCNGGHPVDTLTGVVFDTFVDAVSPDLDSIFAWRRHYRSAWARHDGDLGPGFRHDFEAHIVRDAQGWCVHDREGLPVAFAPLGPHEQAWSVDGSRLRRGAGGRLTLLDHDGALLQFEPGHQPRRSRLAALEHLGRQLRLHYDQAGQLQHLDEWEGSRPCGRTRLERDDQGHVIRLRHTDDRGHDRTIVHYGYQRGQLVRARDAEGGTHAYEHDARGRLCRMVDPNGYVFTWTYDEQGRCIATRGQDGLWKTAFAYDLERGITRVTEREGGVWLHHHDREGGLLREEDPYGGLRTRQHDAQGRAIAETDFDGSVSHMLLDARGRVTARRDPWGRHMPHEQLAPDPPPPAADDHLPHQARGWIFGRIGQGDALPPESLDRRLPRLAAAATALLSRRSPVTRSLDWCGRAVRETDDSGAEHRWAYDRAGNVVAYVDPDGQRYGYETTSWNLHGAEIDPLGHRTTYRYSSTEQLVEVRDPLGTAVGYTRDEKDRITAVTVDDAVHERHTWDTGDNPVAKHDGAGSLLLESTFDEDGLERTRRVTDGDCYCFDYDDRRRVTEASAVATTVRSIYAHDGVPLHEEVDERQLHRLLGRDGTSITRLLQRFTVRREAMMGGGWRLLDPTGREHRVFADTAHRVAVEPFGRGGWIYGFDPHGRLQGCVLDRPHGAERIDYRYSPGGQLRRVQRPGTPTIEYRYDQAHRLVQARWGGEARDYAYDPAGNLALGRPLGACRFEGQRLLDDGDQRFEHDIRGRVTRRIDRQGRTTQYHYDGQDLLVGVHAEDAPAWIAQYDGRGRQLLHGDPEAPTRLLWDGDRLAARIDPEGRLRLYVYPDEHAMVPLLLVDYADEHAPAHEGRVLALLADPNGMPRRLVDDRGQIAWAAHRIDPYGIIEVEPGASTSVDLRWPGHLHDPATGLHTNRFRTYDPRLGRYLQPDPLGLAGSANLYAYPANPLVHVDLLGLSHPGRGRGNAGKGAATPQPGPIRRAWNKVTSVFSRKGSKTSKASDAADDVFDEARNTQRLRDLGADDITIQTCNHFKLTPESRLYRIAEPKYVDTNNCIATPNPNSCCTVADPTQMVNSPIYGGLLREGMSPADAAKMCDDLKISTHVPADVNATSIGPGLNMAGKNPGAYGNSSSVVYSTSVAETIDGGATIYRDTSAKLLCDAVYVRTDTPVPIRIERMPTTP